MTDNLHDGSRTYIPHAGMPRVTTQMVLDGFARKLADLNRRNMLKGATGDFQTTEDPRDLLKRIESMCAVARMSGDVPSMNQAEAVGAFALALALSVARVEDQAPHLGDAA